MRFKIAYGAGHFAYTPGNKVAKELDPGETREWVLNDRVARYFAEAAEQYEGVELLRTDDITGATDVGLAARCSKANEFQADFCLSIHHNAGANLTKAGGIVAFSHPQSKNGAAYRNAIYDHCIAAGGLRGNRAVPKTTAGFYVLRYTEAPCVLMEYGFMDSRLDAPVILQEAYSRKMAYATMAAIAEVAGLRKKNGAEEASKQAYSLEAFVREVQTALGASVDGVAGPETLSKTVTLSIEKNDTHPAVKPVQKRLYALGYSQVGEADGVAGPKFREAVIAFQQDNDCWRDGIITAGNKTWRKLLGLE
jgi:N-acetylmuramoyl-L-alanine amidase